MLSILFEDQSIIVVKKPSGVEAQAARGLAADMVSEIRKHIHKSSPAAGELYVGVIHRLDKPVQGVMVYAKTKKAASALSKQTREGKLKKIYQAVVCGNPVDNVGNYVDYLLKDGKNNYSKIVDKGINGSKRGELRYKVLKKGIVDGDNCSLVEIELVTGRHHQIRVQMSGHGTPIYGDTKYGKIVENSSRVFPERQLCLCASQLSFYHPDTGKKMEFSIKPEGKIFQMFFEE
ncbi:RluA family pseudouridine synthase [Lachnospiraceae bacterium 62-35]